MATSPESDLIPMEPNPVQWEQVESVTIDSPELIGNVAPVLLSKEPPQGIDPASIGAFFDVDQTLVRGATSFWAAREMFRRSFFGSREIIYAARKTIRYVLFGEDQEEINSMADRAARTVDGHTVVELEQVGQTIFDKHFVPKVYQGTYNILKAHIEAGHTVYLVSATPWLIAEELARRIGAAGGIGTKTKVRDGLLVGELDGKIMHGAEKVVAVEEVALEHGLDLARSYAYSDSMNDAPMLSMVGHPVAVNPDRALRAYAREHGWAIYRAYETKDIVKRRLTQASLALGLTAGAVLLWKGGLRGSRKLRGSHRLRKSASR